MHVKWLRAILLIWAQYKCIVLLFYLMISELKYKHIQVEINVPLVKWTEIINSFLLCNTANPSQLCVSNTQHPHTDGIGTKNRYRTKWWDIWDWAKSVCVWSHQWGGVPKVLSNSSAYTILPFPGNITMVFVYLMAIFFPDLVTINKTTVILTLLHRPSKTAQPVIRTDCPKPPSKPTVHGPFIYRD